MISDLDALRMYAVKQILRKVPADYLLRQSLCKPWISSTHLDEMAWTDFKTLFFNFPKIRAQLDRWTTCTLTGGPTGHMGLDPGEEVTAFMAAACHEILHCLWLHKFRGRKKRRQEWRAACEYAINYELANLFGKEWIHHLNVMYPGKDLMKGLKKHSLPPTTDGFYEVLCLEEDLMNQVPKIPCTFCERCEQGVEVEDDDKSMVRVLNQLPEDSPERKEILEFLVAEQAPPQKVPWEMLMLGGIENAMSQEQSWASPSRRNELLPGWRHEKLLSFVWILDVSPSIDDEMKQSFVNTLQAGINLYHDAQHRVIFFADGIMQDILLDSGSNLCRMQVPSGDGTDLAEVWRVLEQDKPEYALVLTDLELYEVPKPTYTKIVWGIVGNRRMFDPDYGVKIVLK